jgi:hypothetical protein
MWSLSTDLTWGRQCEGWGCLLEYGDRVFEKRKARNHQKYLFASGFRADNVWVVGMSSESRDAIDFIWNY